MSHYEDLSRYTYDSDHARPGMLNVGWLDREYPIPQGDTSKAFQEKLLHLCRQTTNETLGLFLCPFCEKGGPAGSGEIHVPGRDGVAYAAPELIGHYVTTHGYKPPDVFIKAVMETMLLEPDKPV